MQWRACRRRCVPGRAPAGPGPGSSGARRLAAGMPVAVIAVTSRPPAAPGHRQSAASQSASRSIARSEDPRGGRDLGLGRLQDRLPARAGPGGKRRAEVAVVGVFGRDGLALPVGELAGEGPVPGGQVGDPLVDLAGRLVWGEGEFVALGAGGGLGFGRAQRREVLAGVAAAQFGVGGDGQLALGAGGVCPSRRGRPSWRTRSRAAGRPAPGPGSRRPACAGPRRGRGRRGVRRRGPRRRRAGRPGGRPRRRRGPGAARPRRTGGPRRSRPGRCRAGAAACRRACRARRGRRPGRGRPGPGARRPGRRGRPRPVRGRSGRPGRS